MYSQPSLQHPEDCGSASGKHTCAAGQQSFHEKTSLCYAACVRMSHTFPVASSVTAGTNAEPITRVLHDVTSHNRHAE